MSAAPGLRRVGLVLCAALAACARREPPARYVATIPPVAFIVRAVAGTRGPVRALLPAGASPELYEPRPSDVRDAAGAAALIAVDPRLDGWAARIPSTVRIEMLALVPAAQRTALDAGACGRPAAPPATLDDANPHFWTDPSEVRAALPALAARLAALDPAGRAQYDSGAVRFGRALDSLDAEIAAELRPFAGRSVIVFHPSFTPFLVHYGLCVSGVVERAPGQEPTPRSMATLIDAARRAGTRVVIAEPQLPPRAAAVIAQAIGGRVVELDPLGGVPGRETYEELLRAAARALAGALQ